MTLKSGTIVYTVLHFSPNNPLVDLFNIKQTQLFESGIFQYWEVHFFDATNDSPFNSVLRPIRLSDLRNLLVIFIVGLVFSCFVFMIELLKHKLMFLVVMINNF